MRAGFLVCDSLFTTRFRLERQRKGKGSASRSRIIWMDRCTSEGTDSMAVDSVMIGWSGKRGITGLHGFACLVFLGGTRGDVVRYF